MLVRVDPTSKVSLYQQIAQQVREAISAGGVGPGERLPTARALAASLQVNLQTVLRAYAELRDEGLVEMRRRKGVTVIGRAEQARLGDEIRRVVSRARQLGMSDEDIHNLVREHL